MTDYEKVELMLNSYIIWVNDVKNLELEIELLKNDYDIKSIEISEKTGPTFKINNDIEDRIIGNPDKIYKFARKKKINEINIEKVNNAVEVLGEFEKKVIELKYLEPPTLSWKGIAYKLNASISTCKKTRIRAVQRMVPLLCH